MTKKVKQNKDGSVTVILNGRDNAAFWTAADRELAEWVNKGYTLTYVEKGGNTFKDGILTSFTNLFRTLFGMSEKHDPVVKMTFAK